MAYPRILLAAPKSGSGKTLITCALLRALSLRGLKVRAFKCGPDYIDPMFHQRVLGVPSRNLDLFFTGEDETRALFLQDDGIEKGDAFVKGGASEKDGAFMKENASANACDVSVIEGVMGLYDGLAGTQEEASSYHLACTLKTPILLIINARGMGRSMLAEIAGFLSMDSEKLIKGVILNQVSRSIYESMAPIIERELGIKAFGYYPTQKDLELESRYLGLKLPNEISALQDKVTAAAKVLEETVLVDDLLKLAREAGEITAREYTWLQGHGREPKIRIGVALDEAFCFYYEDNFRLLRNAGAELVSFSPLRDEKLPEGIQGILLGGGYPELMAKELSENEKMRTAIREAIRGGMPSLAECGGFMYLHDEMASPEGEHFPMVGVIHGICEKTGKLVRFGYASFLRDSSEKDQNGALYPLQNCGLDRAEHAQDMGSDRALEHRPNQSVEFGANLLLRSRPDWSTKIRGHEFHYYDSTACGEDLKAVKPVTGKSWRCGYLGPEHLWAFAHLYYPSNPDFATWFVTACRNWKPAGD